MWVGAFSHILNEQSGTTENVKSSSYRHKTSCLLGDAALGNMFICLDFVNKVMNLRIARKRLCLLSSPFASQWNPRINGSCSLH
jgi:hypothetical protein